MGGRSAERALHAVIGVFAHRRGYALDPAAHRDALLTIARRTIPVGLVLDLPLLFTGPLGSLAALGRIALTGYLLQSMLVVAAFLGLRLYGRTELLGAAILGELAFVAVVWAVLLTFALWWTARLRYGPGEWLWRWGTDGVRPQMRV